MGYVVAPMIRVELQRSHASPVAAGHPWVFAQAVARTSSAPQDGDEVVVVDPAGKGLGRGFWAEGSAISVRLLTRDPDRPLDAAFFATRLRQAAAARQLLGLPSQETSGYRLVHSEGDGLGGLIADVYGEVIVVQLLTAGIARRIDEVVAGLAAALGPSSIVGLRPQRGGQRQTERTLLYGAAAPALRFVERGLCFDLGTDSAQKTGYYFDQREHRAEVERLARDREVLDACCYVGSFALAAARGGARSVLALDSSEPALRLARKLAADNAIEGVEFREADVRSELDVLRKQGRQFDLVVFDPPKLVPTIKHLERGRRAYRRLNAHAIALTRPGGLLVTCSCSAALNETEFSRMLALASGDVGRELCILRVGKQGADHPLLPGFAEGAYLKTAFAIVR
jgi:23S rRNA (cytosine1962-C5)-methyltransferase